MVDKHLGAPELRNMNVSSSHVERGKHVNVNIRKCLQDNYEFRVTFRTKRETCNFKSDVGFLSSFNNTCVKDPSLESLIKPVSL